MKNTIVILLLFIGATNLNAQDTIIKNNGERVIAKITEIALSEIKYKRFNFQDGPTYIENKKDIEVIRFANGVTERFGTPETPDYAVDKTVLKIDGNTYVKREKIIPYGQTRWDYNHKYIFRMGFDESVFSYQRP